MGKYDDKYKNRKNEPADVFISLMLRDMANELAEANRLKRIELESKLKLNAKDKSTDKLIEELLQDKA